jgi:hypothetical protein
LLYVFSACFRAFSGVFNVSGTMYPFKLTRTTFDVATIRARKLADGTVSYTAQIRIKRDGVQVYQETQTFARKQVAQALDPEARCGAHVYECLVKFGGASGDFTLPRTISHG